MRMIDADELKKNLGGTGYLYGILHAIIDKQPTIYAVPVNHAELKHLINDTIAYIWGMEDRGATKPEFGYDSRKELLEKLKRFEKEHFPENDTCTG